MGARVRVRVVVRMLGLGLGLGLGLVWYSEHRSITEAAAGLVYTSRP